MFSHLDNEPLQLNILNYDRVYLMQSVRYMSFMFSIALRHTRVRSAWINWSLLLGILFGCVSVLYAVFVSPNGPLTDLLADNGLMQRTDASDGPLTDVSGNGL